MISNEGTLHVNLSKITLVSGKAFEGSAALRMAEDEFVCSPSRTDVWDENGWLCPYTVKLGTADLCLPAVGACLPQKQKPGGPPTRYRSQPQTNTVCELLWNNRPSWIVIGGLVYLLCPYSWVNSLAKSNKQNKTNTVWYGKRFDQLTAEPISISFPLNDWIFEGVIVYHKEQVDPRTFSATHLLILKTLKWQPTELPNKWNNLAKLKNLNQFAIV